MNSWYGSPPVTPVVGKWKQDSCSNLARQKSQISKSLDLSERHCLNEYGEIQFKKNRSDKFGFPQVYTCVKDVYPQTHVFTHTCEHRHMHITETHTWEAEKTDSLCCHSSVEYDIHGKILRNWWSNMKIFQSNFNFAHK